MPMVQLAQHHECAGLHWRGAQHLAGWRMASACILIWRSPAFGRFLKVAFGLGGPSTVQSQSVPPFFASGALPSVCWRELGLLLDSLRPHRAHKQTQRPAGREAPLTNGSVSAQALRRMRRRNARGGRGPRSRSRTTAAAARAREIAIVRHEARGGGLSNGRVHIRSVWPPPCLDLILECPIGWAKQTHQTPYDPNPRDANQNT